MSIRARFHAERHLRWTDKQYFFSGCSEGSEVDSSVIIRLHYDGRPRVSAGRIAATTERVPSSKNPHL